MPSLTVSLQKEFVERLDKFAWVNWSAVTRKELIKQEEKLELIKELDELTKNSELTDKDCLELGRKINKGIAERSKKEGW